MNRQHPIVARREDERGTGATPAALRPPLLVAVPRPRPWSLRPGEQLDGLLRRLRRVGRIAALRSRNWVTTWAFQLATGGLALTGFLGAWWLLSLDWHVQHPDLGFYQGVGEQTTRGLIPYRDFDPAYPPLALPLLVLPSLLGARPGINEDYAGRFEVLVLLVGLLLVVLALMTLVGLRASRRHTVLAMAFVAASPLLVGSILPARYDLWPAALTTGALAAVIAGRYRLGSAGIGLAAMAKVYPLVVLPLVLGLAWRRRGTKEALACAGLAVGAGLITALPFLVLAPTGLLRSLDDLLSRPLQVETLGASLLWVAHAASGLAIAVQSSYGSDNLVGTLPSALEAIQGVALVAVLAWVWIRFARTPSPNSEQLVAAAAAAVCAFVLFGKVLSGQFLIWLVPLVPLVGGRRGFAATLVLAAALLLMQQWYPSRYPDWIAGRDPGVSWIVLARNLTLAGLLGILLLAAGRLGESLTRLSGVAAGERRRSLPAPGSTGWSEWVKDYYRQVESYDWVDVADRLRGPEAFFHRHRERLVRRLIARHAPPGEPILDAGCGTGLNLRHLPPGAVGLDINPRNIALVRRRCPEHVPVLGDLEAMPFADESFGTVVCTEVLEHVPRPERALGEIRRVLRPGGILIGSVPADSWIWRLRFLSSTCPGDEPFHHQYTTEHVRGMLGAFEIVDVGYSLLRFNVTFVARRAD